MPTHRKVAAVVLGAVLPGAAVSAAHAVSPVDGTITTPFGQAGHMWSSGKHTGVDFAVPVGTPVKAAASGVVIKSGPGGAYGNELVIKHDNGQYTQYAHLSAFRVHQGAHVAGGDVVALSGNTGNSTGPHLHFELRTGPGYGTAIDPAPLLGKTVRPATPAPSAGGRYTVKTGDTLGDIARQVLGDKSQWRKLYDANRDRVADPNLIYPGQVLRIPAGEGATAPAPRPKPAIPSPDKPITGSVKERAAAVAASLGKGAGEIAAMVQIIERESSWNPRAVNPSSGACGLVQSLPCSKLPQGVGTSVEGQIRWFFNYVDQRYGSARQALAFWNANKWY
ncbi:peptidoglycan DD-metalloendopeptidase family protein [Streptomyces sp. NPDC001941]|uniref:aggregation-promoting factor C-terminal-like domain-containing protein n=1 Tax=Streptomyces sp. NPDC001941 TaxID=3154659 RepID=UPI00331ADFBA